MAAPALMLVYDVRCSLLEEGRLLQPPVRSDAPRLVPKPKTAKPSNPPWVRAIRVRTDVMWDLLHHLQEFFFTQVFSFVQSCRRPVTWPALYIWFSSSLLWFHGVRTITTCSSTAWFPWSSRLGSLLWRIRWQWTLIRLINLKVRLERCHDLFVTPSVVTCLCSLQARKCIKAPVCCSELNIW
jgi:hypothetical protein